MERSDRAPKKNPHEGHRERMRERFASNGFDNYRPHEVLEQMLFYALPRVNTNEIAHDLLEGGRDVIDVLYLDRKELIKTYGIGEKAADYIRSIIPRVSDMILRQYRELPELNVYNIAFLGDWFLRYESDDKVGIIICDSERRFIDFAYIDPVFEDGELDPYATGDIIAKQILAKKYYIIAKQGNVNVTSENMLTLRDYTSRLGSFMVDAYAMHGMHPMSYLYLKI